MEEKRKPQLEASWLEALADEFEQPYMQELRAFLQQEKKQFEVYPPGPLIFNAFNTTPLDKVKVVILGQDPYHGPGQAHGLSFSVRKGVRTPPSLVNMYQEIQNSLGIPPGRHGELTAWAEQGVLMLNTTLTVRRSQPKSHAGKGWETFTDRVIRVLDEQKQGLVFMLWGAHAKAKSALINHNKHLVLAAPHPSPYSARSGFFGCGHFAKANDYLQTQGQPPIDWRIPD